MINNCFLFMNKIDFTKVTGLVRNFLHNSEISKKRAILIRSCENQGNLSGTIGGWTDVKLTDYGRRQSFLLNKAIEPNMSMIHHFHSSDL